MAYSNESVSEIYLSYLLLVVFLSIKLFAVYGIIKQIKAVVHLLFNTPNFGDKSRETIGCDLSQKVYLGLLTLNGFFSVCTLTITNIYFKTECMNVITLTNKNGNIGYGEEDFLHYLVTYGSDPDSGLPMLNVPGGDGRTNLMVNIF